MSEKNGQNLDVGTPLPSSSRKTSWLTTRVALLGAAVANLIPNNAHAQQQLPNVGQGPTAAPASTLVTTAMTGESDKVRISAVRKALAALKEATPGQGGKDAVEKLIVLTSDGNITPADEQAIKAEEARFGSLNGTGNKYGLADELAGLTDALKVKADVALLETKKPIDPATRTRVITALKDTISKAEKIQNANFTLMALKADLELLEKADNLTAELAAGILERATVLNDIPGLELAAVAISNAFNPALANATDKPQQGAVLPSEEDVPAKDKFDPDHLKRNIRYDYPVGEGFQPHPSFAAQAKGTVSTLPNGGLRAKVEDAFDINAGKTKPFKIPERSKGLWVSFTDETEMGKKSKGKITPLGAVFIYRDGRTESKPVTNRKTISVPTGADTVQFEFCITRQKPTGTVTVQDVEIKFE